MPRQRVLIRLTQEAQPYVVAFASDLKHRLDAGHSYRTQVIFGDYIEEDLTPVDGVMQDGVTLTITLS